ncbi:hypothetical protein EJB05_46587, partial [Eragrostis curvula]
MAPKLQSFLQWLQVPFRSLLHLPLPSRFHPPKPLKPSPPRLHDPRMRRQGLRRLLHRPPNALPPQSNEVPVHLPVPGVGMRVAALLAGVVMVVPLDLAITPMRVPQDPLVGPRLRTLLEEGDFDDRLLLMLFLMAGRLSPGSL